MLFQNHAPSLNPHQEVVFVFPPLETGQTFVNTSTNRMLHK